MCPAGLQRAARGQGLSLPPLSAPPAAPTLFSKAREGKSLKYFLQWLRSLWVLGVVVDGKVNESAECSGSPKVQLYPVTFQLRISYGFRILRPLESFSVAVA